MARDTALLARAEKGEASARVYRWDGPWVSLGRSQNPHRALIDPAGISHVMRPTGGKAVLHGHDLTVGLAVPLVMLELEPSQTRSVIAVYRQVVAHLVQALVSAGVSAALGEGTRFLTRERHTSDCFAHVSPNDVVDVRTGQKVCGCALRLTSTAVLVQASIPVQKPLVPPEAVFPAPATACWLNLDPVLFAESLEASLHRTASRKASLT